METPLLNFNSSDKDDTTTCCEESQETDRESDFYIVDDVLVTVNDHVTNLIIAYVKITKPIVLHNCIIKRLVIESSVTIMNSKIDNLIVAKGGNGDVMSSLINSLIDVDTFSSLYLISSKLTCKFKGCGKIIVNSSILRGNGPRKSPYLNETILIPKNVMLSYTTIDNENNIFEFEGSRETITLKSPFNVRGLFTLK